MEAATHVGFRSSSLTTEVEITLHGGLTTLRELPSLSEWELARPQDSLGDG